MITCFISVGSNLQRLQIMFFGSILTACAEPFDADRHDLVGFRIAAAGVFNGYGDAMIWSGEGLYHQESPQLRWYLDDQLVGEGYRAALPSAELYRLEVENAAGEIREAQVQSGQAAPLFSFQRYGIDLEKNYSLDARQKIEEEIELDSWIQNSAARVRVDIADGYQLRWMTAMGEGTILELDRQSTDFVPKQLFFQDNELEKEEASQIDSFSLLALAKDNLGGNRWAWVDLPFVEGQYLRHFGQLFPTTEEIRGEKWLLVDIEFKDDRVHLTPIEESSDLSKQSELACASEGELFQMSWIAQGRCSVAEVDQAQVVIEIW